MTSSRRARAPYGHGGDDMQLPREGDTSSLFLDDADTFFEFCDPDLLPGAASIQHRRTLAPAAATELQKDTWGCAAAPPPGGGDASSSAWESREGSHAYSSQLPSLHWAQTPQPGRAYPLSRTWGTPPDAHPVTGPAGGATRGDLQQGPGFRQIAGSPPDSSPPHVRGSGGAPTAAECLQYNRWAATQPEARASPQPRPQPERIPLNLRQWRPYDCHPPIAFPAARHDSPRPFYGPAPAGQEHPGAGSAEGASGWYPARRTDTLWQEQQHRYVMSQPEGVGFGRRQASDPDLLLPQSLPWFGVALPAPLAVAMPVSAGRSLPRRSDSFSEGDFPSSEPLAEAAAANPRRSFSFSFPGVTAPIFDDRFATADRLSGGGSGGHAGSLPAGIGPAHGQPEPLPFSFAEMRFAPPFENLFGSAFYPETAPTAAGCAPRLQHRKSNARSLSRGVPGPGIQRVSRRLQPQPRRIRQARVSSLRRRLSLLSNGRRAAARKDPHRGIGGLKKRARGAHFGHRRCASLRKGACQSRHHGALHSL